MKQQKSSTNTTSKPNPKNQIQQHQNGVKQPALEQCQSNNVGLKQQSETQTLSLRVADLENKLNEINQRQEYQNTQIACTDINDISGDFRQIASSLKAIQSQLIETSQCNSSQLENIQAQLQEQAKSMKKIENQLKNIIPQGTTQLRNQELHNFPENINQDQEIHHDQSVGSNMRNSQQQYNRTALGVVVHNQGSDPQSNNNSNIIIQQNSHSSHYYDQTQRQQSELSECLQYLWNSSQRKSALEIELQNIFRGNQELQNNEQFKQLLRSLMLDCIRKDKVDQNYFLSSFVYQYLNQILTQYNRNKFEQYLNTVSQMSFQLGNRVEFPTPQIIENYIRIEFMERLIKYYDNKQRKLEAAFGRDQNIFYALAMIYIGNLVYQLYLEQQAQEQVKVSDNFCKIVLSLQSKFEQSDLTIVIDLLGKHLMEAFNINQTLKLENIKEWLMRIAT